MTRPAATLTLAALVAAILISGCDDSGLSYDEREANRYQACLDAGGSYERLDGPRYRCDVPATAAPDGEAP